jgi:tripartite-type tricarboxylate transporter receptor subunit TctC
MHRRPLLAAPALLLAPAAAHGQRETAGDYPSRPVAVLSGYAPGGVTDTASRAVSERMSRELGQTLVVENKVGAATAVASTAVAQARPDGYTLLMGTTTLAINPALQPGLTPKEPLRELAPVGPVFTHAFVLHVHPALPVHSTAELIAWCRANPGRLNFGSSGTGAVNHLAQALFAQRAGIEVTHVPYRGGAPALLDLRAGRIQAMFQAVLEAQPVLREGATRGLGVSSPGRDPAVPDLPPVAETLPGFQALFWQGLFAPAGTPAPVIGRLNAALNAANADPALLSRMAAQGVVLQRGTPQALHDLLVRETAMWGELIRSAGIRAET